MFSKSSRSIGQQHQLRMSDFKLGKNLGEGKFGVVYQAIHKDTNGLFALKKVKKAIIKSHMLEEQFMM
jgi:serine/threonine protein kinase